MKILVLSDSHAGLQFMRMCIDAVRPQAVIHLGDYFDDGRAMAEEYPHIPFHQVPGNCDRYRCPPWQKSTLCYDIGGARLFMTHGHLQNVKADLHRLLLEARKAGAAAALYGHTHCADCRREDGLWILNPGSCGSTGGSAGLLETRDGQIVSCRILRLAELEEMG